MQTGVTGFTYRGFMLWVIVCFFIGSFYSSCVPPREEVVPTEVQIIVQDSLFQRISDVQDLREGDELYAWLRHRDPTYRYLAARAFASIQAEEALDSLALLLTDPVEEVRAMAAFAMGQSASPTATPLLIEGFIPTDTAHLWAESQRAILEAVGKTGDKETLNLLSSVTTYEPTDTALIEGQAFGIYRFGLRNLTSAEGTQRMLELAQPNLYPASARLIAANYLARMDVALDSFANEIGQLYTETGEADIRMALAIALGKTRQESALNTLISQYARERDYRVKCNILRALTNFPYENCRALIVEAIRDQNEHVARRAAEYLLERGAPEDATLWWRFAKDSLPSPIHLELYRAANRHLPVYLVEYRDAINAELRQRYNASNSPYLKAAALTALSEFGWNFRFLYREAEKATHPAIRTAGIEGLRQISERADFQRFFGASTRRVEQELAFCFQEAIRSRDAGMVAVASQALISSQHDYAEAFDSLTVLENALDSLELPAQIESYNELAAAIAHLSGDNEEISPKELGFNHPIDWAQLADFSDRNPIARIETSKGTVRLELWPSQTPGTVANFIALARSGFFDGKNYHRVVPNFVIQGGCPRGDGYGSLDYSIRSELTPVHYNTEGLIGMASAGKDTEGTQFFITHSPTLHLDGRYTVFGRVIEGMDNVHDIQVGDKITQITIE